MLTHLDCTKCDKRYEPGRVYTVCECGAPLYCRYDLAKAAHEMRPGHLALREPTMWRYREVLPLPEGKQRVSLGEGFTPLLPAPRLGGRLGLPKLLVKEEAANPTGSFKARGGAPRGDRSIFGSSKIDLSPCCSAYFLRHFISLVP